MKNLPVQWTKHLKDQDSRSKMEDTLRASKTALGRLLELVEERESELLRAETSLSDFDDPNWSHKQAFRNGKRSALKDLKELLEFIR